MNDRTRHRRVLQLETLEDRIAPSGGSGTAALSIPTGIGRSGAELRILQDRGRGAQRLQNLARRQLDAAFAGFNRALANVNRALNRLDTAGPRGQEAALRGFNRAFDAVLRAETRLDQAFVTSPTVLQDANRARLQSALDDLGRLDDRIEQILEQPPASGALA